MGNLFSTESWAKVVVFDGTQVLFYKSYQADDYPSDYEGDGEEDGEAAFCMRVMFRDGVGLVASQAWPEDVANEALASEKLLRAYFDKVKKMLLSGDEE